MRIPSAEKKEKLRFFKELYETAVGAQKETAALFERHYLQYCGDDKIDGSFEKAKVVRNITKELIESKRSAYIPQPIVTAEMWSEKNERNAKSIECLLRNLRNKLPYEKMNDIDEIYTMVYGGRVAIIEWDNSTTTHNTVGEIKKTIISPKQFIGQPNIFDISEMEYCFCTMERSKDDLPRLYGVEYEEADDIDGDSETNSVCTIIICYYKNDEDKICQYVWADDTVLSDIDDYYARKKYICKTCGQRKELCSCDKPDYEMLSDEYEELDHDIALSDGTVIPAMSEVYKNGRIVTETQRQPLILQDGTVAMENVNGVQMPMYTEVEIPKLEKTKLPYYQPTKFPIVIRKNTSKEDSLWGESDAEAIRPQQQEINKIESRISEKLQKAGVYTTVPEDFVGELDNSIFGKVIRVKQGNKNLFGTIELKVDIQQDMAQSNRVYDHAKRILNVSESFQGQYDPSATSGVAKQMQIRQTAGIMQSSRVMQHAAYAEEDEIIFQLYLAFADEPREIAYKDAQGRIHNAQFNRYDFIERDENGEYYYNDRYLFAADKSVDMESDRPTMWQENRLNYQSGAYGNPAELETQLIFWQNMEKAHYPTARENVARISENIKRRDEGLQAQLAQAQAQIEKMNNPDNLKAYMSYLSEGENGV
jgi:hypothetical protein